MVAPRRPEHVLDDARSVLQRRRRQHAYFIHTYILAGESVFVSRARAVQNGPSPYSLAHFELRALANRRKSESSLRTRLTNNFSLANTQRVSALSRLILHGPGAARRGSEECSLAHGQVQKIFLPF